MRENCLTNVIRVSGMRNTKKEVADNAQQQFSNEPE